VLRGFRIPNETEPNVLAAFSAQFTWIDWLVVVGYLAFTTWLGARMAGRQATIRDFFLGGRKLPWYAVSGSIVATEISALTFVSVPWVVFQPGGNFTYIQLGVFGSFFARILVGYILVPAYYEREIYSPYDYMGHRLGGGVRSLTTVLFTIGGMLAQSARIYLTGEVLVVVLNDQLAWLAERIGLNPLAWAVILITGISVAWTLIGGITTVIWTDVVLFLAFLTGALVALAAVVLALDGGWGELFHTGWQAKQSGVPWAAWGAAKTSGAWGKFTFFDWNADPTRAYTIWTAVIAATWGGLSAYGTDQLMTQRMFCCRNPREARWAIISSAVSQVVTITVALVGAGLFAYYSVHTPSPGGLELVADKVHGDRIFPIFIVDVIPVGFKGLIIAAIFAAAISSVMGILTALSQTVQSAFYNPWRERFLRRRGVVVTLASGAEQAGEQGAALHEDRRSVLVGRMLVLGWAIILGALAYFAASARAFYPSLLDLGLAMAGYVGGALLAGFMLAFLRLSVDGRGYLYAGPLSVMSVFALIWHQGWTHTICWTFGVGLLLVWFWRFWGEPVMVPESSDSPVARQVPAPLLPRWLQTLILLAGVALMLWLNYYAYWQGPPDASGRPTQVVFSWPWQVPIGSTIAFVWGYLLARRKTTTG